MQALMSVYINGERRDLPRVANVRQLLSVLGVTQDRIAVEVNRRIVRRDDWDRAVLEDGDRVEIVQFVGGG